MLLHFQNEEVDVTNFESSQHFQNKFILTGNQWKFPPIAPQICFPVAIVHSST